MSTPREQVYETNRQRAPETTDASGNPLSAATATVAAVLGTTYCLVVLCILLIIPIIELAIGSTFRNQCTINPNIPTYLVVTGACGLASIVLTIAIAVAFACFITKGSLGGTFAVICIASIVFLILFLMSLFLFAWFIAGNVWIFGAKANVVFDDTTSPFYCHPTLYNFAFTILILSYVMAALSCCASCFRVCFQVKNAEG